MNKVSIGFSVVLSLSLSLSLSLAGCDKNPPTPTKTEVRSIHIAGMPVYEKDYRLNALEQRKNRE